MEFRELLGEDGAHDAQVVAEQGGTLFKVDAEGRELDGLVAGGNAEDQAVAREPVDRCHALGVCKGWRGVRARAPVASAMSLVCAAIQPR